jgi:hypothetical protein
MKMLHSHSLHKRPFHATTAKREAPATVVEWAVPINEIRQAVCLQAAEYRKGGLGKSAAMREAWRDVKAGGMNRYVIMPEAEENGNQLRLAI